MVSNARPFVSVRPRESRMRTDDRRFSPARISGLNKRDAEDMLDWLEAHDVHFRFVTYHPRQGFTIEYKRAG